VAQPTVQKNYRLPWELVKRLEEYCKKEGITETSFVIEAIKKSLQERVFDKTMYILTNPDNEHYDADHAREVISNLAERFDIVVQPTGHTRDRGHGQEEEFVVSGSPENVRDFQEALNEELY